MLKQQLSAAGISDASHLRGAIQQALIQFGAVPDLPQSVLDSTGLDTSMTAGLAANNPFSTLKRLQQSYEDQQASVKNQLAARGGLSSGETGYQLGRAGQAAGQGQYDATNTLLGGISGLNDAYVQGQQQYASQLAQGALTAQGNVVAQNPPTPGSSVTATYDPATGTWVDPGGNHYGQDGNPIALPAAPQSGGLTATPAAPGLPAIYNPGQLPKPGLAYAY